MASPSTPILDSRAIVGLREPDSISHKVWPTRGGLAIHWAGDTQGAMADHDACRGRVRQWQAFHMGSRGWVDLAYNWVICQHGTIMVGRGWSVRSAANGTQDGNDRYLAACWLGGEGDPSPTVAALNAFDWLIIEIRRRGAGRDVQPHGRFLASACPGKLLADRTVLWRAMQATDHTSPHASVPRFPLPAGHYFGPRSGPRQSVSGYYGHRADLARWQVRTGLLGDGLYGPRTAAMARRVQTNSRLDVDALIGPRTWAAAWAR